MESAMITNRDFIFFGLQPWDIPIGSNCKNIAMEVAKHNRVLYVNRPLDRISLLTNKKNPQTSARVKSLRDGFNTLSLVAENLWMLNPRVVMESINFLPHGAVYKYFNRRNSRQLAREILKSIKALNFNNPILFIDDDFFHGLYLKEYLQPSLFVYYIRDYLLSQQYFKKHGAYAEPEIIKKADAVAANSRYLANYAQAYNNNACDVGQGCAVEDFLPGKTMKPADVQNMRSPVIGYCGSLTITRIDLKILEGIARQRPGWNILLVGPEDKVFRESALHQFINVHFTGSKPEGELPGYIHSFDVCINPQLLNQMTIGNYPRKVDEYLAAGKPVVATDTVAMEMFGALAYTGRTVEDYIRNIESALKDQHNPDLIQQRIALAKSHTWEASVNKLYSLINKTMKNG